MASLGGQALDAEDNENRYASASQWRHQESNSFSRHAAHPVAHRSGSNTSHLKDFFHSSRTESHRGPTNGKGSFKPIVIGGTDGATASVPGATAGDDGREIVCGPLLNYRRMEGDVWYGSVLIVTSDGGKSQSFKPVLSLGRVEVATQSQQELVNQSPETNGGEAAQASNAKGIKSSHGTDIAGICLYSDPRNTFWAFPVACDMVETETKWAYSIPGVRYKSETKPRSNYFFVPALDESMRVMFHSCNGFSVGTDEEAYSGAALWNDVMRRHTEAPFHVMIGGGDQIYNDGIRVNGPLRPWTDIANPKKRRDYPFPEELRQQCDDYYLKNYLRWYSTEPFATANGQIPQLNIWDDHDIIDGFGSYTNDFMKCNVFRGIGGTAHKYYMLFQHHLAPPRSTYTTDAPQTMHEGGAEDSIQLRNAFVGEQTLEKEPSYIVGLKAGPYVAEHSMSMFARLGARIAFLGIDARIERTRHQVNYPDTYDLIFNRLRNEIEKAAQTGKPYKHLILLLGIPIAYPRLTWLENVFRSPLIGPIKFLNRRFGFAGGLFNHFDGSVDLLDDLDDHYTAKTHKRERQDLIERLQEICAGYSLRVTILGGDVHLAALGRFYSAPNLHIPVEHDHRYMVNVVSSAIVNKPPPAAIANLLARRNKIHHLNVNTDETLLKLFDKDPGDSHKTASYNNVTMPSRNFAIITENSPNRAPTPNGAAVEPNRGPADPQFDGKDGHFPLGRNELGAGAKHKAASPSTHGKGNDGTLDCAIRVEINQHDKQGKTEAYGLTIPLLDYQRGKYNANEERRLGHSRPPTRPRTPASQ